MAEITIVPEELGSHQLYLRRLARRLVSNDHDADDLVQEVMLSALEHPPQHLIRFRGWLRVATIHAASRLFRRNSSRLRREERAANSEAVRSTSDRFEEVDFHADLERRVLRLGEPYREVVAMRYLDDLPILEIAHRLERPTGTVRCQLKRGLDRLRSDMDRRYGSRRAWAALALGLPREATRVTLVSGAAGLVVLALGVGVAVLGGRLPGERTVVPSSAPISTALAAEPIARHDAAARRTERVALAPLPALGALQLVAFTAGSGEPVADLDVLVERVAGVDGALGASEGEPFWTRTDGNGARRLAELAPGTWRLTPERGPAREVEVVPAEARIVSFPLPPAQPLGGRVVDQRGEPVAGCEVLLSLPGRMDGYRVHAITGPDGAFHVSAAAEEAWILACKSGWYTSKPLALATVARRTEAELELQITWPAALLSGTVRDAEGRPAPFARVRVDGIHYSRPAAILAGVRGVPPANETIADAEGRFCLAKDRSPSNRVVVVAEGHAPLVRLTDGFEDRSEQLDLVLPRPARASGKLFDEAGAPCANTLLVLEPLEELSVLPPRTSRTDADGAWALGELAPGAYRLRCTAADGSSTCEELLLAEGEERVLESILGRAHTLRGRLVDASGGPLAGWTIVLEDQVEAWERLRRCFSDSEPELRRTRTDEDGRFSFGACVATRYTARAHVRPEPGSAPRARRLGLLPGPVEHVLRVGGGEPSGRILGRILAPRGDLRDAQVTLRSRDVPETLRAAVDARTGAFEFDGLAASPCFLRVDVPGRPQFPLGLFDLADGERLDLGALPLPEGGTLLLRLVDQAGQPVPAAEVRVGGNGLEIDTRDDAMGVTRPAASEVRIPRLWPGTYVVLVQAPGFAARQERIEVLAGEVSERELVLSAGLRVDVVVRAPRTLLRYTKLNFEVYGSGDDPILLSRMTPSSSPERLLATSFDLPHGRLRIEAASDDGLTASRMLETSDLLPGETVVIELVESAVSLDRHR